MRKVKAAKGKLILREGEATGHHHSILAVSKVDVFEEKGEVCKMNCKEDIELSHQEHDTLIIKEKEGYKIGTVKEYNHVEEEVQKVKD